MPAFLLPQAKNALLEVEVRVEEEALDAGKVGLQSRGVGGGAAAAWGRGQPVVGFVVAAGRREGGGGGIGAWGGGR